MQGDPLSERRHGHAFHQATGVAERSTRLVVAITAVTMVVEIAAGWWFNSMALLADGWHMGSHTLAIGLSVLAYAAARRYAHDSRFAFGTWKVEVLGGFASAILLLGVAAMMIVGSVERLVAPQPIGYPEAIAVAVLGLAVNVVCAWLLGHAHDHDHDHAPRADLNLKAAYLHVVLDAATSVLAIVALAGGWLLGWSWLDPVMGIVGAVLVAAWARGLVRETAAVLLDREMDHPVVDRVRAAVEAGDAGGTRITDLHVWRVGTRAYACALTVVTRDPLMTADDVRRRLQTRPEIVHSTIEVHRWPDDVSA